MESGASKNRIGAALRFLTAFVVVAAVVSLPQLEQGIGSYVARVGVFAALFFVVIGVPLLIVLRRADRRIRTMTGVEPRTKWELPIHSETVASPLSPDELLDRAWEVIRVLPSTRRARREGAIVKATTGFSWASAGERITVRATEEPGGGCCATIVSRPRIPFTVFDYGKNRMNVEQIVAELAET